MKIRFTGQILGGPDDGEEVVYEGEAEGDVEEIYHEMIHLRFHNHVYSIIEFDPETKHCLLQW